MPYIELDSNVNVPLLDDGSANVQPTSVKSAAHVTNDTMPLRRKKYLVILISLGIFASFVAIIHLLINAPAFNQYKILRAYQNQIDNEVAEKGRSGRPRTILLWNSFFEDKRWGLSEDSMGPNYFRDEFNCHEYRCDLTNNRDFLPTIEMFDAVLFHTAQPFPLLQPVPRRRSPHQQYVFALMEPPGETKHVLTDEAGFYNMTMSYRLDSDIMWPYQYFEDIETGELVAPAVHAKWRQVPVEWNETSVSQVWEGKTRMAAWFVSHCETLSKREKLAAALQEYIDVDIYGKCGNLSCPRSSNECDRLLDVRYKFYFSFENSLCNDYVTEKLYNAMRRNVIPVVFGAADYSRFVPPNSVINAEDFQNVAELASHLQYVATHPEEYMRYFWWRRYYRLSYRSPFCDLCEKLHSITNSQKTQTYLNIEKWWMGDQCRFESKIKF
ncbi:alpha-(1,3)-fucosyltransferase C [Anastrepha ludens]|uniref:alpha-(1,3)-fucosyltransferase C n=1 Tax=Anastrepha ludens TaxID=28586 RepID=UPI0023B0B5DF|nr:alpha-(1,3)-fucosyltransferase C [Anastrepha ludens]XP_053949983.1 alpha-(1,3)-fucosyltransferase C [Anastrepha ludens]XP_053949984.1 alpha-(1,3)-fucosyltransferase C [Anastrepha ludens]